MSRPNLKSVMLLICLVFTMAVFVACASSDAEVPEENKSDTEESKEVAEAVVEEVEEPIVAEEEEPVQEDTEEIVEKEPEPEPAPEPIGPDSHLTGLPIHQEAYDRRPVGIMISNIEEALPQHGVSDADILYEIMVEGGITRLFALYQDFDTEKIGPVRSSRHYFLDLALEHDAIYTHVGQSVYAIEAFKYLDVDRFYGISYLDLILTYQDEERKRPHSTFTGFDYLMDTWETTRYRKESDYTNLKFTFNEEENLLESGESINKVQLIYSGLYPVDPYFIYNEEEGLYYRYQYEAEHIDANNGEQLKFKNIIVQYATTWWIKDDPNGCIDMTLISSGNGFYMTNGKMVPITWEKTGHYDPTYYYYEDGTPLVLNKGKTFVSVYPRHKVENILWE